MFLKSWRHFVAIYSLSLPWVSGTFMTAVVLILSALPTLDRAMWHPQQVSLLAALCVPYAASEESS